MKWLKTLWRVALGRFDDPVEETVAPIDPLFSSTGTENLTSGTITSPPVSTSGSSIQFFGVQHKDLIVARVAKGGKYHIVTHRVANRSKQRIFFCSTAYPRGARALQVSYLNPHVCKNCKKLYDKKANS